MNTNTQKTDAIFSEWDKPDSPGCALAIIKDGEFVYKRGYGVANFEYDIPITSTTVFDIGSTSKQFTALCIVILARQEKLSLDDDIKEYFPEIPQYKHPITIRHLIHHTSGIRDYLTLMDLVGMRYENEYPDNEIIDLICRQKELNFEPGEEFLYSNSGYLLLGEIVRRVSGTSLRAFTDEWVFNPLGMKKTHFHDDFTEIVKDRSIGYSPKGENGYKIDMSIFDVVGDGCVYSTVEDLYLWDQNFYHNIIGDYEDDLIEEITIPGQLNNGELLDYAFGLVVEEHKGLRMVSHVGEWAGFRSDMIRFPEQRFSVICLANLGTMNPTGLAKQVADIYLTNEFIGQKGETIAHGNVQSIELPSDEIESKVGFYRNIKTGTIWELMFADEELFVEASGMRFQLVPTSPFVFHAIGIPDNIIIEFDPQRTNDPQKMHVSIEGRDSDEFSKIKIDHIRVDELKEYEGIYYCEELEANYELRFKDDKLFLFRKGALEEAIKSTSKDLFKGSLVSLQFIRDEEMMIVGFEVGAGRVKNLRFGRQNLPQP